MCTGSDGGRRALMETDRVTVKPCMSCKGNNGASYNGSRFNACLTRENGRVNKTHLYMRSARFCAVCRV